MLLTDIAKEKITVISGPFGAGKTNIAVNLALALAEAGEKCLLADLDTVNPYFRSADNARLLNDRGVETLIPEFANTNVDIPALPKRYDLLFSWEGRAIADVGGAPEGAAVLGVSRDEYISVGYDMYFVYNYYRPLTSDPADALEMLRHIERVSGLAFGGIINNSNLGKETDEGAVAHALPFAKELSETAKLPLILTTSPEFLDIDGTVKIKDVTKKLF